MTIRQATPADVPALVRLVNAAYHVEEFFAIGERTSDEDIRERMARPNALFLLLEDAGIPAGSIFVQVKGARGFFAMLSVDPSRQRQGLGRRLVEAAEAHCRAHGCQWLDLDVVNLRTELPPFYRKLGFAPYDTAPFHRPETLKQPAHLVLMTKPL